MISQLKNKIKKYILNSRLFKSYTEYKIKRSEIRRFKEEAYKELHILPPHIENYAINSIKSDYLKCLRKRRIQFSEYFHQYEFHKLSNQERESFITRSEMQCIYRRLVKPEIRNLMHNKSNFLTYFNKFIKRNWIYINSENKDNKDKFFKLIGSKDCIIKPQAGSLGNGIVKTECRNIDINNLWNTYKNSDILVEECIRACEEIESFNPDSLNTIRVVTISNGNKSEVFGAFIRMGRKGSVIDNAHAGGIFAQINVDSGRIESPGINTNGERFDYHPDSNKQIIDFQIPKWDLIKTTCVEASLLYKDLIFAGWDIVVLPNYDVEIIECNHAPDFDVMQSPLKTGVKQKLFDKLSELNISM